MKTIKVNIMKNSFLNKIVWLMIVTILASCNSSSNEMDNEHDDHEEGETNTVSISVMQAQTIGLEVGPIKMMPLGNTVKVTGVLELFPQDRAEVSPLLGGNVKSIHTIEGDEVTKGQLLATMQHPDFIKLQQEYQMKFNSLDYLKLEYDRQEKLFKDNVSSAKDHQKAKSVFLSAQSELNGLKITLRMLGLNVDRIEQGEIFPTIPIVAPISGYVHLVNVNIGEFAGPQMGRKQIMFEITDNSRLHVDIRVYEKDIYRVKVGQKVFFTVANQPGMTLEATIHSVGKAFEDEPKSVHLHAEIENKKGELLPGMYVEGRIATSLKSVKVLPEEAIVTEGEKTYIFIKVDERNTENHEESNGHLHEDESITADEDHNHKEVEDRDHEKEENMIFQKTEVIVGIHDAGYVEVKLFNALPESTLIVLLGAYTLSSEMIKGELEHEH